MKQYKIFTHPSGVQEAVKQGWSWPGFCFGGFWALVKKMWGLAALILIGGFSIGFVMALVMPVDAANLITNIIALGIAITIGVNGNQWRENNLFSRGYQTDGELVEAKNPDGAVALFLGNETSIAA
ncbi:DUF2628 domain-containing protein [Marinobacter halophilus]|uniref:DUF2628 domain-containing protein n=1 Tax=Marinobacter halophilus TaxID=1323740 RepID=A0A2T1KJ11_9GAMM|nr:DUF2628 domain-containing protein [Marinobacter halophilus]PSF09998.1 hypothetical protein C7H08_00350 [Marinobacter halophilus]GGC66806.1 hypothetical protein GCM10011362_14130 [Marinobacter halophilus]